MNEIVPRCPNCCSAHFLIGHETIMSHIRETENDFEDNTYTSTIEEAASESYIQLAKGEDPIDLLEGNDLELDDLFPGLSTLECRTCGYIALFEEVGLTYWRQLPKLTDNMYIYESATGRNAGLANTLLLCLTEEAATKYNKLKRLYTTNDIAELTEFLAHPELCDIAKRRYDDLTRS